MIRIYIWIEGVSKKRVISMLDRTKPRKKKQKKKQRVKFRMIDRGRERGVAGGESEVYIKKRRAKQIQEEKRERQRVYVYPRQTKTKEIESHGDKSTQYPKEIRSNILRGVSHEPRRTSLGVAHLRRSSRSSVGRGLVDGLTVVDRG